MKILLYFILSVLMFADSKNGWTPLHQAIYSGDNKKINLLISPKNISKVSKAGISPLHLAVKMRQEATVDKLIKAGADVDIQDNFGQTPLHYALSQRLNKIAKKLIKNEADMDLPNRYGITALHQEAYRGDSDMLQYMIDNGATVDIKNKQGLTPCQLALARQNIGAASLLKHYTKLPCDIPTIKQKDKK